MINECVSILGFSFKHIIHKMITKSRNEEYAILATAFYSNTKINIALENLHLSISLIMILKKKFFIKISILIFVEYNKN